jgi:hypothetical protein
VGATLLRERFLRCWFPRLSDEEIAASLAYTLDNGCEVYRLRYLCVLRTELWWIRSRQPKLLVAEVDNTVNDAWKLVEVCPDGSRTIGSPDAYSPSQPYSRDNDTLVGQSDPQHPPPRGDEESAAPLGPPRGQWVSLPPEPKPVSPIPPSAGPLPKLWMPPEYTDVTSADVHTRVRSESKRSASGSSCRRSGSAPNRASNTPATAGCSRCAAIQAVSQGRRGSSRARRCR